MKKLRHEVFLFFSAVFATRRSLTDDGVNRARQLYKNISMLFLFPVKDGKLSTGVSRVVRPFSAHETGSRNRAKNIYFEYLIITKEYLLNTPKKISK